MMGRVEPPKITNSLQEPMEGIYSYAGTVAGLALKSEDFPYTLQGELAERTHQLGKLLREAMPSPSAAEFRLIDDKVYDDR